LVEKSGKYFDRQIPFNNIEDVFTLEIKLGGEKFPYHWSGEWVYVQKEDPRNISVWDC
jgi:hypothetical protein